MPILAKKKISIISHNLVGGGMTRAYALAQALIYTGHNVEIIGIKLTTGSVYPIPPENITVTEVSGYCMIHRLWKLLLGLRGDIIYAIKPMPSSYGVALVKRYITGCPIILDIDDWQPGERELNLHKKLSSHLPKKNCVRGKMHSMKTLLHRLLNFRRWLNPTNVRYTICVEQAIAKANAITVNTCFLQQYYGGTYLPHCKDINIFNPDKYNPEKCRVLYGLADYIVLMFPGTARPHKGLEDILIAIEGLQNPAVRLVIVGGRRSADCFVTNLMQRWPRWIVRLPAFSTEKMPSVIAAAHIVVIPQRDTSIARAQFPIKLTDAMAMAKPILTTTVGDIPKILAGTGYLVSPSNPDELKKMLSHLLENLKSAENSALKARERLIKHFSLGVVGSTLSSLIEDLP